MRLNRCGAVCVWGLRTAATRAEPPLPKWPRKRVWIGPETSRSLPPNSPPWIAASNRGSDRGATSLLWCGRSREIYGSLRAAPPKTRNLALAIRDGRIAPQKRRDRPKTPESPSWPPGEMLETPDSGAARTLAPAHRVTNGLNHVEVEYGFDCRTPSSRRDIQRSRREVHVLPHRTRSQSLPNRSYSL